MKFDERNQNFFFNSPFFASMATAAKFVQPILIFFLRKGTASKDFESFRPQTSPTPSLSGPS
jgi:hypothetical protein